LIIAVEWWTGNLALSKYLFYKDFRLHAIMKFNGVAFSPLTVLGVGDRWKSRKTNH
jgi:hypothetical protein